MDDLLLWLVFNITLTGVDGFSQPGTVQMIVVTKVGTQIVQFKPVFVCC